MIPRYARTPHLPAILLSRKHGDDGMILDDDALSVGKADEHLELIGEVRGENFDGAG